MTTENISEQAGIMNLSVLQNLEIPVASRAVHVLQEKTNFAQQVLEDASEDVWNEL